MIFRLFVLFYVIIQTFDDFIYEYFPCFFEYQFNTNIFFIKYNTGILLYKINMNYIK